MLTKLLENEILLGRLVRSLTFRRFINLTKVSLSYAVSTAIRRPVVWGVPPILTLEPANICNLRCPLCITGAGELTRPSGKMSLETFTKLIDLVGDDILCLVAYNQGEPYLNKHFFDFVRMAKNKNIYVTTSTNGHFFTPANIRATIESGLDSMIVSIDGVTQETYAHYRVGGDLDRVIDGVRGLVAERRSRKSRTPNVALQLLVMRHNEHQLQPMEALVEELGADRLLVKRIDVRTLEEARTWLPGNPVFSLYKIEEHGFIAKRSSRGSCPWPWFSGLVYWDGTFVPCCYDKNGNHPMGQVVELSLFDEMWLGGRFHGFRKQLLENRQKIELCRNCNQTLQDYLPRRLWKRIAKSSHS